MKVTAIWIIDENYRVPAYASICSFIVSNEIPVVVVYCSTHEVNQTRSYFTGIHPLLCFETYEIPAEFKDHPQKATITNRLARMHYAEKSNDEIILLVDADVLFSNKGNLLLEEISANHNPDISNIFGVLDAKIAYRDYLYFRTTDENGRDIPVPHLKQKDIYTYVFGTNWWHHLKGASINNGIIAFYKCSRVIDQWRTYYLKGLTHSNVNPGDDQLPLAAAIHKTSQNVVTFSEIFNSKGDIEGQYIVYHALSSAWKMQFYSAFKNEDGVSDFADIAKEVIHDIPQGLLNPFIESLTSPEPYLYKKLEGSFGFKHLYEDIISGMDDGIVVEVGMQHGKSSCYMLELIAQSGKEIQLNAFQSDVDTEENLNLFFDLTKRFDLNKNLDIIPNAQVESQGNVNNDVDFVFLNLDNRYGNLLNNLEYWYSRLKPGGILSGYDYTSQIGLSYGNKCATFDFCERLDLPLRISFDIFIIEKPPIGARAIDVSYQLQTSNYPL